MLQEIQRFAIKQIKEKTTAVSAKQESDLFVEADKISALTLLPRPRRHTWRRGAGTAERDLTSKRTTEEMKGLRLCLLGQNKRDS